MYYQVVTRFKRVFTVPNTVLGIYSRSSSVAALALLEQEKLEQAKETIAQTALTLSVLDIGGNFVLPVVEEIVDHIRKHKNFLPTREAFKHLKKILLDEVSKSADAIIDEGAVKTAKEGVKSALNTDLKKFPRFSKVSKAFTRASKWLKGASVFDVLGPLTDSLSIGINIWGLKIAIEDGNAPGIAAASLSIAAGVVGLTTFVAAIVTGSAVLGPVGAIIGAVLGLAATLIELIGGSSGYDKAAVEAYRNRLRELRNLRDACAERIDQKMKFLDSVGTCYTDVYVNNQVASMSNVEYFTLKMKSYWEKQSSWGLSLNQRKYVGQDKDVPYDVTNSPYLCTGTERSIWSPVMPMASSSTGWGKAAGEVGFDFYGKFKKGTTYKGVYVFVDSDFVNLEPLNDIDIDTESNIPDTYEMHDVVSIGDYKKFNPKDKNPTVKIKTGRGDDILNINGVIGEFHDHCKNVLKADLGGGHNILSFQGISKDRNDIKGIFFDSKTGALKYFHGTNRDTHLLGTVKNVELLNGSPFNDHVILYPNFPEAWNVRNYNSFKVVQQRGSNEYEINCDDVAIVAKKHLNKHKHNLEHNRRSAPWFQIIDKSNQAPKLNLKTTSASNIKANDVVIYKKKLVVYDRSVKEEVPFFIFSVLLETETTANLFINNADPRPIIPGYISPVPITGEIKVHGRGHSFRYKDGDESNLLFLKWDVNTMGDLSPRSMNYVDMKGGINYVLISEKYLIEPLGIDGSSITLTVRKAPMPLRDNYLYGSCDFPIDIKIKPSDYETSKTSGYFWELCNVEKIINEYGDELIGSVQREIIQNDPFPSLDLYEKYVEVTQKTLQDDK